MSGADSRPPVSMLVRAPNWLGDCVMALPTFAALREALPRTRIVAAVRAHLRACYDACADIDEVAVVPPAARGAGGLVSLWRAGAALRSRRFDAGLLLTNSFSSALWLWRTGTRRRIGYARDGRRLLLTEPVAARPALLAAHQADYYLHLAARFGADPRPRQPRLVLAETDREEARQALRARNVGAAYLLIAPFSAYGEVKDWPAERYAAVAERAVREWDLDVVVAGTPAQREAGGTICVHPRIHNLAGATGLGGFCGLIDTARLFLGGDSGGAHVAAALDKPTVVVFGITEPSRTRALGRRVVNVGRGGAVTPNLNDPAVRKAAREALAAVSPDEVFATLANARADR